MSSNTSFFHNILGKVEAEEKLVENGLDKTIFAHQHSPVVIALTLASLARGNQQGLFLVYTKFGQSVVSLM